MENQRIRFSVDDSATHVIVVGGVIEEAMVGQEKHSKGNPNWEVAAKAVVKLYEKNREEYDNLFPCLRETAHEYFQLREAMLKLLLP